MSHVWISRDTLRCFAVMSHICMSHVTCMNESCHTSESVAIHCGALQWVAMRCSELFSLRHGSCQLQCGVVCCSILQSVAVCCTLLQYVAERCSILLSVAVGGGTDCVLFFFFSVFFCSWVQIVLSMFCDENVVRARSANFYIKKRRCYFKNIFWFPLGNLKEGGMLIVGWFF